MELDTGRIYAIVTLFIGFIIVSAVAIPVTIDMAKSNDTADPNADMRVGDRFHYTPETTIPGVTIYTSGSAWEYGEWSNGEIVITWGEAGEYDLILTAVAERPHQEATQTIHFKIDEKEPQTSVILYVIPTVLIVGLIMFALRKVGGIGVDIDGDTRIGGGGDMFSGNSRGFGKR